MSSESGATNSIWCEIDRLTTVQLEAATAGRLADVAVAVAARGRLLTTLGAAERHLHLLADVARRDAQTMEHLQAQHRRIGEELARLREGGRALHGYRVPARVSPGFVDRVQ